MKRVEEILLLHHSHLDVGYTHSQPIVWELQLEYLSQAVDWLEQTADLPEPSRPTWTCEATEPVLRWLAAASEQETDRFTSLVRGETVGAIALSTWRGCSRRSARSSPHAERPLT